jgi:hypothetical protein
MMGKGWDKAMSTTASDPLRRATPRSPARDLLLVIVNVSAAVLSGLIVLGSAHACLVLHLRYASLPRGSGALPDYHAALWIGYAAIAPNAILLATVIFASRYAFIKRKLPIFAMILAAGVAVFLGLADAVILYIKRDFPFAVELWQEPWGWQIVPSLVAPWIYCVFVFVWLVTERGSRPKKQPVEPTRTSQCRDHQFPPPNVL